MMAAIQKRTAHANPAAACPDVMADISNLYLDAALNLPSSKLDGTVRQWLSKSDVDPDENAQANAMILALDLELFAPSLGGMTPLDRLARRRRLETHEAEALAILKRARFTLLSLQSVDETAACFTAENLATKSLVTVFYEQVPSDAAGATVAARVCTLPDGSFFAMGPVTPLDAAGLAVAMDFVRPDKGLNDQRCAAAVYRHVVRYGTPQIVGFNVHPELAAEFEDEFDDGAAYSMGPVDEIAKRWATSDGESTPAEIETIRTAATTTSVIELVFKGHSTLKHEDLQRFSDAYCRMAELQMETLHRRAVSGSGKDPAPFETIVGAIDDEIAENGYPPAAKTLFIDLRDKLLARASSRRGPTKTGDELTRVIDRIRALRTKTLDQGCTESEVMAAAGKVAELLDRYGLSLSAIDIQSQTCEGFGIETRRKRATPLDGCLQPIARFCDCRAWLETTAEGLLRSVFFGLPADVEAARYLYDRVSAAFETETRLFQADSLYVDMVGGERRMATKSFQIGLSTGITAKLNGLKTDRDHAVQATSGRDLVPLKAAAIEDDLAKLGLNFKNTPQTVSRRVQFESFQAGQVAGRKFVARDGLG